MCKIVTTHVFPPIPIRTMDWQAHFDDDEPDDNGHMRVGRGATEAEAIADLLENADEDADGAARIAKLFQARSAAQ